MRRGLMGAAALLCVLGFGVVGLVAGLDAGWFRSAMIGYLERSSGRRIVVSGQLQVHLLSAHPWLIAQGVTIGNPPWTPPGTTAQIDTVTLAFSLPLGGHRGRIDSIRMQGATLTLYRDAAGHANWQHRNPDKADSRPLPVVASLSAVNAQVQLDDQRRHLNFQGRVSAEDAKRPDGAAALLIQGIGQLNGRAVTLELTGDPLPSVMYDHPYRFSFSETSSGSRLTADGALPKPFDFNLLEASFEASGENLQDLYFLTGVTLVNSGHYRLTGRYSHEGSSTRFSDLRMTSGLSDLNGAVAIDTPHDRSQATAKLNAQVLHLADFGLRASGREPPQSAAPLVLSSAAVNADALRRADVTVDIQARRVDVGRQVVQDFSAKLLIERGIATAAPIVGEILGGKLSGRVRFDATQDPPLADVDFSIAGLQLAQMRHQGGTAPVDGSLDVRLKITGRGRSIHGVAATAEGSLTAVLPQGAVRSSLAELAGMDLRGIGLALEKNKRETPVRCAAANLLAHAGIFTVQRMIIDTEPVRISGAGAIDMDGETLDLVIRGEPKSLRVLRLHAPLLIRGTLAHPSFGVDTGDSKLLLLDPGRAKDEDCAALVQ